MAQHKYITEGNLLLQEWLKVAKINKPKFAKKTDIPYQIIWRICSKKTLPTLENAIKIEKATKGVVKCISWELLKTLKKPSKRTTKKNKANDGT